MRDIFFDPSGARGETAGRIPRGGPRVGPRTDRPMKRRGPPVELDVRRASCPLRPRVPSAGICEIFLRRARRTPLQLARGTLQLALCDTATQGSGHRAREAFRAMLEFSGAMLEGEREFSDRCDPRPERR